MTLLLDTHVLLWWLTEDDRLTPAMRAAIADPRTSVAVSAASAWEMAIKAALGRLAIPEDLAEEIERQGFDPLPVSVEDGLAAGAAATPCRPLRLPAHRPGRPQTPRAGHSGSAFRRPRRADPRVVVARSSPSEEGPPRVS